jgi:predicted RND superfamily exporter protein
MIATLPALYDKLLLRRPVVTLLVVSLLIGLIGFFARDFKLDASADSLALENDQDLRYYRSIRARYGSDDFLIISYTPHEGLFTSASLTDLRRLRDKLLQIESVDAVVSLLDVPLIDSPRVSLGDLVEQVRTLESPDTDVMLARREFLTSPLYRNLILSLDGKTTALQVNFKRDETYYALLNQRNALREKLLAEGELSAQEKQVLDAVSKQFKVYAMELMDSESADIARVRAIMDMHRDRARLHLGGVPMIVSDMIDFIRHDLVVFGVGVLCFLVAMLATIFRKPRWVILPMLCCFASVLVMFGYLGLVQWRVTVVSSNFISLMLIITLSLTVHLIVRYHELYADKPLADQRTLVLEMVRTKSLPSFYTALTTIVAFASLMFSNIRPVIDFGWMMAIGISVAFVLSFVLFPAGLMLLKPHCFQPQRDVTGTLIGGFAHLIERYGRLTLGCFFLLAILSTIGISRLTVENRFIDHFKKSTEIYRGMELIDRELGGTTPLDVILDADLQFLARLEKTPEEDPDLAEFEDELNGEAGLSATSYWYNTNRMEKLQAIHDYLQQLPESGKVLSLWTTMSLLQQLNEDEPLDSMSLAVIHKKLTPEIKTTFFDPYMSQDGNQVRYAMRIIESEPSLRRNELLQKIRRHLVERLGLVEEQVHLSGMFVLYNNVLRSLYRSQILTIGVVFLVIMVMFMILFRSLRLAVIAIIPNLIAAGTVLGMMGWLNIPLDIMTITIAAITIGIAVDDTIHYVHRYSYEICRDGDQRASIQRCHASVGRAMYYTSITVIIGFSILALSNFIPTIYFGIFTGLAMAIAMIANLTLLPLLLMYFGPPAFCWLPPTKKVKEESGVIT